MFKGKCKQTHVTHIVIAQMALDATRDFVYTTRDQ